jgi:hypothetical protein
MKGSSCAAAVLASLLLLGSAHRAPAPIVEEEKPSPTPDHSEVPKRKHSKKPPAAEWSPSPQAQPKTKQLATSGESSRFTGTWTGTINQGVQGDVSLSLTINANATSVQEVSRVGTFTHSAATGGNMLTWKSGWLSEINWTFAPNGDGRTATVTSKSAFGVNGSATFHKQ